MISGHDGGVRISLGDRHVLFPKPFGAVLT
jgi:hypothetical protein